MNPSCARVRRATARRRPGGPQKQRRPPLGGLRLDGPHCACQQSTEWGRTSERWRYRVTARHRPVIGPVAVKETHISFGREMTVTRRPIRRHRRELPSGSTSVSQPQRPHSKRAIRSGTGPRSSWGRTVQTVASAVRSRIVTNHHATSRFCVLASHFRARVGTPKKSPIWGLA